MALLTKAEILAASDLPTKDVDCPEWGGVVRVRTLTAHERDLWETRNSGKTDEPGSMNIRASLVALCCVDEDGKQMFGIVEIPMLGKKSAKALDRVFDVCCELNRIGAAALEEAKKNEKPIRAEYLSECLPG